MGSGGNKGNMREIDDTRGSLRDDAFELILDRIESSGGTISSDEEFPMYADIGMEELEIGYVREVEFSINKKDFKLTRKVQTESIQGMGNQKHLKPLPVAKIDLKLQAKGNTDNDWINVDLEALM